MTLITINEDTIANRIQQVMVQALFDERCNASSEITARIEGIDFLKLANIIVEEALLQALLK